MKKIVIATKKPFTLAAKGKIDKVLGGLGGAYKCVWIENYSDCSRLFQEVAGAEALIVRSDRVDAALFDAAPKLKIVVRAGSGYDNVDLDAATAHGVVVMNTPGQNSNAVAELAIGLAIFGLREMFTGNPGVELQGRTLGLHGFGYVARNVFRIARAFGMKIIVYTRFSKASAAAIGLKVTDSLEQLYKKSDIVSIHVPARGEHIRSVSYPILRNLKDGAVIVNTARKEVVNEPDLLRVMEDKPNLKYLSDVTPDCAGIFAEKFPGRYFFTPKKAGAQTEEANSKAGKAAAEQVIAFFEKGDVTFQVNKK